MLRFKNLGSGSTGNATVVEGSSGTQVRRLLIDCGFGIRQLQTRLAQAQLQIEDLDAVFITHEHSDHIGCALADRALASFSATPSLTIMRRRNSASSSGSAGRGCHTVWSFSLVE